MSTYPGEDPQQQPPDQQAEDPQPPDPQVDQQVEQPGAEVSGAETEPTQPVGYWERQAAEQARQQPPSTGQGPGPTTPYEQNPYGQQYPQQPPYPQAYYAPPGYVPPGQPPPGQAPPGYAPPPYAYPPPAGQSGPPPGAHPGYPPYAFTPPRPNHPQATLAMILGICGLGGALIACGLGLLISPFAWALGRNALKEIHASRGQLGGESSARTGMVLGIIGTVLLILVVIGIVVLGVLLAVTDTSSGSNI